MVFRTFPARLVKPPLLGGCTANFEVRVTGEFVTGTTDMSVVDVLDRLSEAGIRRLPVVDDDGALAGIVTLDDVLVHSSEELERAADVVRIQSPRL